MPHGLVCLGRTTGGVSTLKERGVELVDAGDRGTVLMGST